MRFQIKNSEGKFSYEWEDDRIFKKEDFLKIDASDIEFQIANLTQLTFEVTDSCNLNCKYCGYGELYGNYDIRNNKNLDIKKAKNIIDFILKYKKSGLNSSFKRKIDFGFYGGEPLLNADFIMQIVDYIKQVFSDSSEYSFSMTSNAVLLDRNMDFLAANNFQLLISLDGDHNHNSYRVDHRGNNSFKRVSSNIYKLMKKYPEYYDESVNFNSVLHNKNSAEGVVLFIKNEFGKVPRLAELNESGVLESKKELFNKMFLNKYNSLQVSNDPKKILSLLDIEEPSVKDLVMFLHQFSDNVYKDYNDLLIDKKAKKFFPTGTCLPFGKKMFITVNGKILPCERINQKFALGRVLHNKVEIDFNSVAEMYNKIFVKLIGQCIKCYKSKSCAQCIFTLEDIDNSGCRNFYSKNRFNKYISRQLAFLESNPNLYQHIMQNVLVD